jgi:hypothetical protein
MVDVTVRTLYRYVAPFASHLRVGRGRSGRHTLRALHAEATRLLRLVLARVVVQGCTDFRPGAYRRAWLPLV